MTAADAVATTQPYYPATGNTVQPAVKPDKFTFTGSGSEYFRTWIVNLLLTIVTLGIYSVWAKVRRTRYFYDSTKVAGSSFEYHGNPIAILKGRSLRYCSSLRTTWHLPFRMRWASPCWES